MTEKNNEDEKTLDRKARVLLMILLLAFVGGVMSLLQPLLAMYLPLKVMEWIRLIANLFCTPIAIIFGFGFLITATLGVYLTGYESASPEGAKTVPHLRSTVISGLIIFTTYLVYRCVMYKMQPIWLFATPFAWFLTGYLNGQDDYVNYAQEKIQRLIMERNSDSQQAQKERMGQIDKAEKESTLQEMIDESHSSHPDD